jgi:hypothetical protein
VRHPEERHDDLPDHSATEAAPSAASQLFDLRTIIAVLLGLYGVILTIMGFLDGPAELAKAGGIRINLWSGVTMLVVAALFLLGARTRPLAPPEPAPSGDDRPRGHH